ncbi:exported hypothetical protein [Vibrio nigripulchritudo AM115]|nr:exported hypothetical protein [Vibrio nigripulchritudo AM115]
MLPCAFMTGINVTSTQLRAQANNIPVLNGVRWIITLPYFTV